MRVFIFLLSLLLLSNSSLAETLLYENMDLGFRLHFPDTLERRPDLENGPINLCLMAGQATFIVSVAEDKPRLSPKKFASEVLGDVEITESRIGGKTFFQGTSERTTPSGTLTDRTLYVHYESETGAYLLILVTTLPDGPEEVKSALYDVVDSLKFIELDVED